MKHPILCDSCSFHVVIHAWGLGPLKFHWTRRGQSLETELPTGEVRRGEMQSRDQTKHSRQGDKSRREPEVSGTISGKRENQVEGQGSTQHSPPGTGGDVLPGRLHLSNTHCRGPWAPFPQLGFRDSIWFPGMGAKGETLQIPRAMEWSSFNPTSSSAIPLQQGDGSQNSHEHESSYWKPTMCPGECSRLRSSHPSTSSAFLILYASASHVHTHVALTKGLPTLLPGKSTQMAHF